jgi:CheY-like chemotaxis protein
MTENSNSYSNHKIFVDVQRIASRDAKDMGVSYLEILDKLPKILWILFAMTIFCLFYGEIKNDILPNISSINVAGFSATLKNELDAITRQDGKNGSADFVDYVTPLQQELISERAAKLFRRLQRARILWVDQNTENNTDIRKILKTWGANVDCAKSDADAFVFLNSSKNSDTPYNLIITNNTRTHAIDAENFADRVNSEFADDLPIILFSASRGDKDVVGKLGVPKNILAATNRYDYLLHFVLDVLERGNTPYPSNVQRFSNPIPANLDVRHL